MACEQKNAITDDSSKENVNEDDKLSDDDNAINDDNKEQIDENDKLTDIVINKYLAKTNEILDKYDEIGDNDPYEASEIIDNFLWLGSCSNARKCDELQKLGITHILNVCCGEFNKQYDKKYNFNVCRMDLDDTDDKEYEILSDENINRCFQFIDECKSFKNGRCFVHCVAGVNRSTTITVAYLIYYLKLSYLNAIEYVAKRRIWILSNQSFKKQLILFANRNNKLFQ